MAIVFGELRIGEIFIRTNSTIKFKKTIRVLNGLYGKNSFDAIRLDNQEPTEISDHIPVLRVLVPTI